MLCYKGQGELYFENEKIKFKGNFLNNQPHGNGKTYHQNGHMK